MKIDELRPRLLLLWRYADVLIWVIVGNYNNDSSGWALFEALKGGHYENIDGFVF